MRFLVVIEIDVPNDGSATDQEATASEWAGAVVDELRPKCHGCDGLGRNRGLDSRLCKGCRGSGKVGEHSYRPRVVSIERR